MIKSRRAFQIYTSENLNERYMSSCMPKFCLDFVLFLVLYLYTPLFEMKSSLIAICGKLFVNLNICKEIRSITIFENGKMYGENVIIRIIFFLNLINGLKCVSGVLPKLQRSM